MSYCRWSTFIHGKVPFNAQFNGESLDKLAKEYRDEVSDWYIYYDCASGEERDDQMLALWSCRAKDHPLFAYPEVRQMYDTDDWAGLNCEITQKEFMRKCVKYWLDEVEEEYK